MALITAVFVGHISVTYGVAASWYYYEEGEISPLPYSFIMLAAAVGIGSFLGLFFLIAGYFTPGAYDRKGAGPFLADRLRRLGMPLLIYEIVANPLVHYVVDIHGGSCKGSFYDCQFQGTFLEYLRAYPANIGSIADGPVWFLAALLIFCILYTLVRLAWSALVKPAASVDHAPRRVPNNWAIALFALAIGLATFIVRIWAEAFYYYEPLHLELGRTPQYISLFAQARLQAVVLTLLPPGFAAALSFVDPGFLPALFGTAPGKAILVSVSVPLVSGWLGIRKILSAGS